MSYSETLEGGKFLDKDASVENVAEVASHLKDQALRLVLAAGIGFLYKDMKETNFKSII